MANLREIKTRIESVKSTKQITNAMKMVAASKLRKAQDNIINARPYADHINDMLRTLKNKNISSDHPLLAETTGKGKTAYVVVTSDRGLCGSFNTHIIKEAIVNLKENPDADLLCIGRKGYDHFKKHSTNVTEKYINLFNEMDFSVSTDVAEKILSLFLDENYDKINIIYNEFKSAIQQEIVVKQLLPIVPIESEEISKLDYVYEPDENTIIYELGRKYIHVDVWRIMLESSAAEQGARMTAMDSATENAVELIDKLTLNYNRARQAAITTEIIEISSGAEASQQ
ncbi:MAG: ATP synthase F1 subunit gamma [Candidatus Cloacimonetes bacterium]|jgi:F-type H+-transporting ATPase subunit gamma|nr:ATP synthase F1 subunit gamma [Candidatus Cloacimonadota bacterium]